MTKHIVHCTDFDDNGVLKGKPVSAAYLDGYQFAERSLEGVPIRVSLTKQNKFKVEILIDSQLSRSLGVNLQKVRKQVQESFLENQIDVMSSTEEMEDDDIVIFDDALTLSEQAANFSPGFTLTSA